MADPNVRVARKLLGHLVRQPRTTPAESFVECVHWLGPMVLGVCRRILGNQAEADDAFQATFLAVFRKWDSVRDRRAVAGWVHRIAIRVAVRLARRRTTVPLSPAPAVAAPIVDDLSWKEVRAVLDEELARLPDGLRTPLVLCYLNGMSRESAADILGWSVRTLHRRLEDGRERLHGALARRGLTSLALGCAVLVPEGLRATVPAELLRAASQVGDRLRTGVLSPAVVSAALPIRTGVFGGLSVALAAVVLVVGGWWTQESDSKPAPAKSDEPVRAITTFEKPPFWWGSEAFRHSGGWILDSDLSADGKLLATASWESFVVWEVATGKKLLRVQEAEGVSMIGRDRISVVRLSPDGKQLATVNKTTGSVRLWDVATGKRLGTIAWDRDAEKVGLEKLKLQPFERRKHMADYYLAIEYLDDSRLRIQSQYFTTTWDTTLFKRVGVEYHQPSFSFGVTRDHKRILRSRDTTGRGDGVQPALLLWDPEAGKVVREFSLEEGAYDTIAALSDDERVLATTRKRGTEIALTDWPAKKEIGLLEFVPAGEYDSIRTMEFAPDGKILYAGTTHGHVWVYDLTTKAKVRTWKACANNLMRMHLTPDGKSIHTGGGDGLVRTWRLPDGKEVPLPEGYIGQPVFAWSRARNSMAVGDVQGRIDLWDAIGARITRTLQSKGEPTVQLAFSRSGRLLASSDGKGWTRLWDLETGNQLAKFGGTEESSGWLYNVLQISDDETKLLVRTGYSVKMYRIPEGKELWLAPPKQFATFALSPDGKTVCASSFHGPTALYDANSFGRPAPLEQTKDLEFPSYEARFAFSPDSRVLALGGPKGQIHFFDSANGKQLAARAAGDEQFLHLGFTEDGTFLIALDHSKAFLFDALQFERLGEAPIDVTSLWRYGGATPGGAEKLLTLFRPTDLPKADLETCWKNLDSPRSKEVVQAMWQLSRADELGLFVREKMQPVAAPDGDAVRHLIKDLNSPTFAVRESASRKLAAVGPPVEPFLREALKTGLSAEATERASRLLADLRRPPTPEDARQRRIIFALETNGSPDARRTLEVWAAGAAGAHLTEQSKQALGRMGR